jgi:hypothetical protein
MRGGGLEVYIILLDVGTSQRSVVSVKARPLSPPPPQGKEPPVPTGPEAGWASESVWTQ